MTWSYRYFLHGQFPLKPDVAAGNGEAAAAGDVTDQRADVIVAQPIGDGGGGHGEHRAAEGRGEHGDSAAANRPRASDHGQPDPTIPEQASRAATRKQLGRS